MKIQHLFIYPIKSLCGVEKTGWYAKASGFSYDRHWMLVDEDLQFLTLRELPDLRLFSVDIDDASITVQKGTERISWELEASEKKVFQTKVWDDVAHVQRVEGRINQFFSDLLHKKVSLVKQADENSRLHYARTLGNDIPVSLADGYPYLLLGSRSVSYLNEKLESPITFHRFRPNIVVETNSAHEEDQLEKIQGETVEFLNVKPCARCQIVSLDLQSGVFGKEPLKTLSSYRRVGNKVMFGTNLTCTREGWIHVGESLA